MSNNRMQFGVDEEEVSERKDEATSGVTASLAATSLDPIPEKEATDKKLDEEPVTVSEVAATPPPADASTSDTAEAEKEVVKETPEDTTPEATATDTPAVSSNTSALFGGRKTPPPPATAPEPESTSLTP